MGSLLNDPEAHRPYGPRLGSSYKELDAILPQEFYQPASERQLELSKSLFERAEKDPNFDIPIDLYQAWCELNWKTPHGTLVSIKRTINKLREEILELVEELNMPEHKYSAQRVESELGDVLWCTTSISSDLRINVKHGLMMLMTRYGHNIRRFEDGSTPAWVKRAQSLAFDNTLTTKSVDSVIDEGYQSEEAAIMLIDDDDKVTDAEKADAIMHIDTNTKMLISIAMTNYEDDIYQIGDVYRADTAEYLIARIYVDIAFLAKHAAESSLSEVVRNNVLKLSSRVANNQVDKEDEQRE